jgi:hypothetical protein
LISSVTVSATNPGAIKSLTLTVTLSGGTVTQTISPVLETNVFTFNPSLTVASGDRITFSLSAVIADGSASMRGVRFAGMFNLPEGSGPLAGSAAAVTLILLLLPVATQRRVRIALIFTLLLAASAAGCGGSGGTANPSGPSAGTPVSFTGLPAALNTVQPSNAPQLASPLTVTAIGATVP